QSRGVRAARTGYEVGDVASLSSDSEAEVGGSLSGVSVEVGSIESSPVDGPGGAGGVGGSGSGGDGEGGNLRSNASLLAVVRRYAAGIQYCYEDKLKTQPDLRGKIVLSITVNAAGSVSDVHIVQNTLGASSVGDCVLSQVEAWRFPSIDAGSVTFRSPFVFTPGN
ncbi:MAG TPA: AgmX/PglI C-terminal domain-containing protein, partial [Candidatus Krumholzibacteria bacterium]